jgi:hypothetical protein
LIPFFFRFLDFRIEDRPWFMILTDEERNTVRMGLLRNSFDFLFTEETQFFVKTNDTLCELFLGRPSSKSDMVKMWSESREEGLLGVEENRRLLQYSLDYLAF